jgi:hypothetical protein
MSRVVKRSISDSIPPSPGFLPFRKDGVDMESMALIEEFDRVALRREDASARM